MKRHTQEQTLQQATNYFLAHCPFRLYLTGSHFFKNTIPSDVDYFTQASLQSEDWLIKNGFIPLGEDKNYSQFGILDGYAYNDPNLYRVFRKKVGISHIDVQLVFSIDTKIAIQNFLKRMNVITEDKITNRRLWKWGYMVITESI